MYMLDSCVCIDFMKGKLPLGFQILRAGDPSSFKIPSIVLAELRLGVVKSNDPVGNGRMLNAFLMPFEILPFDERCAYEYAAIRSHLERCGERIGPNDTLIAAMARAYQAVLVTQNIREFRRVPDLVAESWYEAEL